MEASFLEIYNESLRDLLSSSAPSDTTKLEIKMDPKSPGEIYVTNLTPTVVTSEAQVQYNMHILSISLEGWPLHVPPYCISLELVPRSITLSGLDRITQN